MNVPSKAIVPSQVHSSKSVHVDIESSPIQEDKRTRSDVWRDDDSVSSSENHAAKGGDGLEEDDGGRYSINRREPSSKRRKVDEWERDTRTMTVADEEIEEGELVVDTEDEAPQRKDKRMSHQNSYSDEEKRTRKEAVRSFWLAKGVEPVPDGDS